MYITQSFCHAVIAAFIVDISLEIWKIKEPLMRQRFRLIVILFPVVSFPLYQLINPERGSLAFRFGALFDVSRWLNLEIWGTISAGLLVSFLLVFTTVVFLFQEMIPIVRHTLAHHDIESVPVNADDGSPVGKALTMLPDPRPDVFVIDDEEFVMFSTTGNRPAVFLSRGFAETLTVEELQAAIAHEIGHITRSRRPLLVAVFLFRMILFFNPVALMEFRSIVHEEEKICDSFAVSLTGKPRVLAETLRKFYYAADGRDPISGEGQRLRERLEEYSHTMLVENRISRLEEGSEGETGGEHAVFVLTLVVILLINYAVV
jgi:Zn-dependent protease with chaperone function